MEDPPSELASHFSGRPGEAQLWQTPRRDSVGNSNTVLCMGANKAQGYNRKRIFSLLDNQGENRDNLIYIGCKEFLVWNQQKPHGSSRLCGFLIEPDLGYCTL